MDTKYVYFEIVYTVRRGTITGDVGIQNINILYLKPQVDETTGYATMEQKVEGRNYKTYKVTLQFWFDHPKFKSYVNNNLDDSSAKACNQYLDEALDLIRSKIRGYDLGQLLSDDTD